MKIKKDRVLYQFTVDRPVEKFVVSTTDDGTEIKKKEKTTEPVTLLVVKPSRYLKEEAEMFYAKTFNEMINQGLLTKQMMLKKIGDNGGVFSKQDVEEYERLLNDISDAQYTMARYMTLTEEEKEDVVEKEKFESAKSSAAIMSDTIMEFKGRFETAFNLSADSISEKKLLDWYIMYLAYYSNEIKDGEIEAEPLFKGSSYEEKRDDYLKKDDEDWTPETELEKLEKEVYTLGVDTLTQAIAVWFYNYGSGQNDIESFLKDMKDGGEA